MPVFLRVANGGLGSEFFYGFQQALVQALLQVIATVDSLHGGWTTGTRVEFLSHPFAFLECVTKHCQDELFLGFLVDFHAKHFLWGTVPSVI